MSTAKSVSRRAFLATAGTGAMTPLFAGLATPSTPAIGALRREILESHLDVGLHRARVFTRIFQENENKPWALRKALALREYFRTVPLYLRPGDRIAGSLTEKPGAMPVNVEMGIAENRLYLNENPARRGYMQGKVPQEIRDYWRDRNYWARCRESSGAAVNGELPRAEGYEFTSNQGHLSPAYRELLEVGLAGMLAMIPGVPKALKNQQIDERELDRVEAIIRSMTLEERRHPDIISGSRRKRIAAGSGTSVQAVNQLISRFKQMQKMMKQMGSGKGKMPNIPPEMLGGGF
jgi:hypothetical protein